jgi:hypothetical protein
MVDVRAQDMTVCWDRREMFVPVRDANKKDQYDRFFFRDDLFCSFAMLLRDAVRDDPMELRSSGKTVSFRQAGRQTDRQTKTVK